uniref:Mitochondrial DNA polymerase catalytic subunit n=1 Tax=Gongylonema pulchrum TaxID=637853 RepID=A0A183DN26_9BILA
LELTLNNQKPRTPVLDCQLGYCLSPLPKDVKDHEYFLKKYRRSIINWVVQSSAVDFLHLLIVCMKWLCETFQIEARFALSIHDEVVSYKCESDTFNYLELTLNNQKPRTPVLDCQLGYCLSPLPKDVKDHEYFLKKYRRSIINWVVQSSAVDFLHLLIVCMKWLCETFQIEARFALSIHDEIRYIVPTEDRYRCALALTISNMYVRAMISQKLGINQLPMSVAFFSQVDIDRVLRKEVDLACKTPGGEGIPPGMCSLLAHKHAEQCIY